MNYKEIRKRIRNEREKLDLTREKFAKLLELLPNFIGQIERGEKKMLLFRGQIVKNYLIVFVGEGLRGDC